jgi:phosphoglycolate phosphatase
VKALHPHLEDKSHVIWDWNGTLLGDVEHAVRTVNKLLSEENLPQLDAAEYKRVFGFPVVDYYKHLGFDTSPERFAELCERFNKYFHDELHLCDLWPGARETLAHVHGAGKMQSLLSASEHNLLLMSVKQFGVENFFHNVVGIADKMAGSKVARGKELIAKVNLPLDKTVLIGDTDHDLEVGKALGIDVILVDHGHQDTLRLQKVHSKVLKVL